MIKPDIAIITRMIGLTKAKLTVTVIVLKSPKSMKRIVLGRIRSSTVKSLENLVKILPAGLESSFQIKELYFGS